MYNRSSHNLRYYRTRIGAPGTQPSGEPAPEPAALLLDTYPAFAAYSTRLLSSTYAGACMQVREAGGDTTADIGFVDGWLDESAIATHCGASLGYVAKWYDQSGNAKDVANAGTLTQAKIYDGANVYSSTNTKPAIYVDANSYLYNASFGLSQPYSAFVTLNRTDATATASRILFDTAVGYEISFVFGAYSLILEMGADLGYTTGGYTGEMIISAVGNSTSSSIQRTNETAVTGDAGAGAFGSGLYMLGRQSGLNPTKGYHQEYIFWDSDQSSNRTAIKTDINSSYSIY